MSKVVSVLLGLVAVLLIVASLAAGSAVLANGTVRIQDEANVLSAADRNQITAAAQHAPFAVTVWTNSTYSSKDAFYNAVRAMVGDNEVVLGLDPVHRYSHISAKSNTGLTATDVTQADNVANTQFGTSAWGAGFVNAINSMAAAAPANGSTGTSPNPLPAPANGFGGISLMACLLPLILLVGAAFFLRNRFSGNRGMGQPTMNPNYYPQTPTPGGYGQGGYGPQGYNPGGGMGGNLAAGGLGALGGGLIGYELGRHANDQQQGQQPGAAYPPGATFDGGIIDSAGGGTGPDFGGGADFGNSGGADFGNSGGADFGGGSFGGGADFGGSSDFGGGGSGDIV